jgi:hypothetical protein
MRDVNLIRLLYNRFRQFSSSFRSAEYSLDRAPDVPRRNAFSSCSNGTSSCRHGTGRQPAVVAPVKNAG